MSEVHTQSLGNNLFEALRPIAELCLSPRAQIHRSAKVTLAADRTGRYTSIGGAYIGPEVVVEELVHVEGGASLEKGSHVKFRANIGPHCRVEQEAVVGVGVTLEPGVVAGPWSEVGNFALMKSGSVVDIGCKVGASSSIDPNLEITTIIDSGLEVQGEIAPHTHIKRIEQKPLD